MTAVFREIKDAYFWIMADDFKDPRTSHYFLIDSFPTLVCIAILYVFFAMHLGPKLMENRKPFKLKQIMAVYNFMQIITCAYLIIKGFPLLWTHNLTCSEIPNIGEDMSFELEMGLIYYTLKYVDLLDTVFFVLRKKQKQISILNIFHHTAMLFAAWNAARFVPGGHSFFVAGVNTIVHFVMYIYYLVTGLNEDSKKIVWWKKYLTQLQLAQFVILVGLFTSALLKPGCKYPWQTSLIVIVQNMAFLIMFSDYYYHAFILKKNS